MPIVEVNPPDNTAVPVNQTVDLAVTLYEAGPVYASINARLVVDVITETNKELLYKDDYFTMPASTDWERHYSFTMPNEKVIIGLWFYTYQYGQWQNKDTKYIRLMPTTGTPIPPPTQPKAHIVSIEPPDRSTIQANSTVTAKCTIQADTAGTYYLVFDAKTQDGEYINGTSLRFNMNTGDTRTATFWFTMPQKTVILTAKLYTSDMVTLLDQKQSTLIYTGGPSPPPTPTQPTIPTQPTQPTTPTQPTIPTQPTQPTTPTQPTIPTQPTQPTTPTQQAQAQAPTWLEVALITSIAAATLATGLAVGTMLRQR
jgi:hypothetical protein